MSLFQRLICTQKYAIGTSETVLIREVSLFQRRKRFTVIMAQHAMGLGFNLTEREVVALQRCKRYGPACNGTWLQFNRERGGCFTEVQEVWPSMQWDLASNLTEREVVALQRCKRYGPACNGT